MPAREHAEGDRLARAGRAGDETVAIGHLREEVNFGVALGDEEWVSGHGERLEEKNENAKRKPVRAHGLLNSTPMSQNNFDNLMQKFGTEAEELKIAEMRAERRHQIMARVRKVFFILLFLGACAAGYVYRGELQQTYAMLRGTPAPEKVEEKFGDSSKNKAKEIQKLGDKRNAVLDEILK